MDDIRDAIIAGDMVLWSMPNSAVVTQTIVYPRRKYLHCWLIGGIIDEIKGIEPQLKSFAKFIGCDALTGAGRPGWGKAMGGNWKEFSRSFISEFEE